jgi:hypothetical protein
LKGGGFVSDPFMVVFGKRVCLKIGHIVHPTMVACE